MLYHLSHPVTSKKGGTKMSFLQNFSPGALYWLIMGGVVVNVFSSFIVKIVENPNKKISEIFALAELKILKSCIALNLVVIVIFSLVKMLLK